MLQRIADIFRIIALVPHGEPGDDVTAGTMTRVTIP